MTRGFLPTAAAIVGVLALGTAPAAAQGFGFGFGSGYPFGRDHHYGHFSGLCMTEYMLRNAIAKKGYSHIYVNVPSGGEVQLRATQGKWVYLLEVNSCTGEIYERNRLRPAS